MGILSARLSRGFLVGALALAAAGAARAQTFPDRPVKIIVAFSAGGTLDTFTRIVADRLGQTVEVLVEVGPARRTAAAHDAAMRAQRQQQAEREIGADPFVQSLIREFGASIVPGSVRPITPDAGSNGAPSVH